MKSSVFSTGRMTRLAVLVAILLIFCYTPLGRLPLGPIFITLNMIPVVISAILLGPSGGAILGVIFGLWSFSTCFGTDVLGTALVNQSFGSAVLVALMCITPRFIAGWVPGFLFRWLDKERYIKLEHYKSDEDGELKFTGITKLRLVWPSCVLTCVAGSLLNTLLFTGALVLFFAKNAIVGEMLGSNDVWTIIGIIITENAIFEAIACAVAGGGVSRALLRYRPQR
ncbi:MAG: ECF transporter S component [Oscillospiraceae bacterium]|nr:ECF transporter S component [Oscillospiraceae bacterium]